MAAAAKVAEALNFPHVPKSAGTTLNRLIELKYHPFEMYSIDPVFFRWSGAHLRQLSERRRLFPYCGWAQNDSLFAILAPFLAF
jgi:hypothetical protein